MKDQRIQPGEKVLTAGGDMIFPRGLPVGVVEEVAQDPDRDSHVVIYLKPAAQIDRLDEVLVITRTDARLSDQQQQDLATSETTKAPDLTTLEEQKKASEIMAERLPGLNDPNLPSDPQPQPETPADQTPKPVGPTHPPLPLHPDRFSPSQQAAPRPSAVVGDRPPVSMHPVTHLAARPSAPVGSHAATHPATHMATQRRVQ